MAKPGELRRLDRFARRLRGGGVRGTYALEHLGELGYIPHESYERPITAHESIMIAEAEAWKHAGRYLAAMDAETIRRLAGA